MVTQGLRLYGMVIVLTGANASNVPPIAEDIASSKTSTAERADYVAMSSCGAIGALLKRSLSVRESVALSSVLSTLLS